MKTLQSKLEHQVDDFVEGLSGLVVEAAMEALRRRGVPRLRPRQRSDNRQSVGVSQAKRDPKTIATLAETLYAQICRHPGETMSVLIRELAVSAKEMATPKQKLLAAGRIKSVGSRQVTRYFPVGRQAKRPRRKSR